MTGERCEAKKCVAWKKTQSVLKRLHYGKSLCCFVCEWHPQPEGVTTCTWVKNARPRQEPSGGRTVTTTILLVCQQLPQQLCRSLKKAPRRHSVFAKRGPWVPFPCAQRGPWDPFSYLRAEKWSGSLTTSEAGWAGFWSGAAAPR